MEVFIVSSKSVVWSSVTIERLEIWYRARIMRNEKLKSPKLNVYTVELSFFREECCSVLKNKYKCSLRCGCAFFFSETGFPRFRIINTDDTLMLEIIFQERPEKYKY